jgi:hypothetical protein
MVVQHACVETKTEDEESVALVSVAPVTAAVGIGDCVSVACQCKAIHTPVLSQCICQDGPLHYYIIITNNGPLPSNEQGDTQRA